MWAVDSSVAEFATVQPESDVSQFLSRPKPVPSYKGTEAYLRKIAREIQDPGASTGLTDSMVNNSTTDVVIDICSEDELDSFSHLRSPENSVPPIVVLASSSNSNVKKTKKKRHEDAQSTNHDHDAPTRDKPAKSKKALNPNTEDFNVNKKKKKKKPHNVQEPIVFKSCEIIMDSDEGDVQELNLDSEVGCYISSFFLVNLIICMLRNSRMDF